MSNYFSYLPNVYVRTSSYRKDNIDPYVLAKNIFRRIKIREALDDVILGFEQYTIYGNQRPDNVADDFYGDPDYDWVVLLCNNIINLYDEWPMEENELSVFAERKYSNVNDVHHYESQRITDTRGRILMERGRIVPENFRYVRTDGTVVPKSELMVPITNYEYEVAENDKKRNIYLLREQYLTQFVEEFEDLCEYLPSNEFDPETNSKITRNSVQEAFVTVKPTYQTLVGQTSSIEFATEANYGNLTVSTSEQTIGEGQTLSDGSTTVTTGSSAATGSSGTTTATTTTTGQSSSGTTSNQYGSSGY